MPTSKPAPTAQWNWAAHVRVCTVDEQIVVLDLKSNRYLSIGGQSQKQLISAIDGVASDGAACPRTEPAATLRPLIRKGLLVARTGSPRPALELPPAARAVEPRDNHFELRTGAGDLARVVRAALIARVSLRWHSLHTLSRKVSGRRERRAAATQQTPLQALDEVVAHFEKLRPLLFTARDQCLFDSLALIELLAACGHHPHWVLGVKTHPFRAHAWVQQGDMVLNDHLEHVRRFQPILVA